ncbi:uncharacterized protein PG986_009182 [Apiospora aurea]|uniref:Uncharacterized protein n=1 Tax=Apiospora aurea TaxID=335848 RepID=A0ABR1Q874_9PEZI
MVVINKSHESTSNAIGRRVWNNAQVQAESNPESPTTAPTAAPTGVLTVHLSLAACNFKNSSIPGVVSKERLGAVMYDDTPALPLHHGLAISASAQ